jgi:type I restriction enzyme S subunit
MKTNRPQKNTLNEWQLVKLGIICDVSAGGTPSTEVSEYWENGNVPWANSAEINKKNIYKTENFITEKGLKNSSAKLVPVNSVLIALAGQGSTRGKVAVNKISLATNQSIAFFTPKKEVSYSFLRSALERLYQELRSISAGDGGRGGLNLQILKSLKIKLPPLLEQNRIVSVLETWDKSIEKLTQKIEVKKQIKKGLMEDLLTGKKRLSGFSGNWSEKKLADFVELIHGDGNWILSENISEGGRYKIVQLGNIGLGKYLYKKLKTLSEVDFSKVKGTLLMKGDLLINRMVDGNLNLCLFMETGEYVTSVDVCWIRENVFFDNYFLMQLMLLDSNQSELLSLSSGSGRVRISKKNLFEKFKFNIPKIDEQKAVSKVLITADREITTLESKLQHWQEQKRYLLNNLITGTIRTPETLSVQMAQ